MTTAKQKNLHFQTLIVVCGAQGTGKSTALAKLRRLLNMLRSLRMPAAEMIETNDPEAFELLREMAESAGVQQ